MDRKSEDEGRETSRLPVFTDEEKARIVGVQIFKAIFTISTFR